MRNPRGTPARTRPRAQDGQRVKEAVDVILKKLKRGEKVLLPGLGSLLPGAPPSFRPSVQRRSAQTPGAGKAGDETS